MKEIAEAMRAAAAAPPGMRGEFEARAAVAARKKIDEALVVRRPYETKWSLARAYLFSNQAVEISGDRLVPTVRLDDKFRANVLRPRARTIVSSLTANRPRFQAVVGDEDDPKAVDAARLGEEVADALSEHVGLWTETIRALYSVLLCGRGYLIAGFDATRGPTVEVRRCEACGRHMGAAAPPAETHPGVEGDLAAAAVAAVADDASAALVCPACGGAVAAVRVSRGDFYARGLSGWDVVFDPAYDRLADSPWVAVRCLMSKSEAEARFGDKGIQFKEETVQYGLDVLPAGTETGAARRAVVAWDVYYRSSPAYPNGLRLLFHSDHVLEYREEASGDGDLPVAEIVSDDSIGAPYSVGILFDMIPAQTWFNRVGQALMKHVDLTGDPPWVGEEGTFRLTDLHSEIASRVIEHERGTLRPGYAIPPSGAGIFSGAAGFLSTLMDFIAQQWEPARGQPGAGVTSGLQARILIERTATSLAIMANTLEAAVARVGKVLLMDAQRYMPESRLFAFAGEHGEVKVRRFRGADIRGIADLRVVAGSSFPESKEARRDFYLDLLAKVGPGEGDVRRAILDALHAGIRMPDDPRRVIIDQARAEDHRILAGEVVDVSENDFHDVHIETHLLFEATEEFLRAPPPAQVAHRFHVKAHRRAQEVEALELEMKKARIAAEVQAAAAPPPARLSAYRRRSYPYEHRPSGDAVGEPSHGTARRARAAVDQVSTARQGRGGQREAGDGIAAAGGRDADQRHRYPRRRGAKAAPQDRRRGGGV